MDKKGTMKLSVNWKVDIHFLVHPKLKTLLHGIQKSYINTDIEKLCFIQDPNERGTFSQVVETIERHLSEDELSLYQEMEEKYQTERANYYMQLVKNKT